MSQQIRIVLDALLGAASSDTRVKERTPVEFQSNRLYDIYHDSQHWIAKQYINPDELDDAPRREFAALQRLKALDIAPQPIFFDPALGPIVVYEFMEGVMWDRTRPGAKQLADLATVWRQIHTNSAEPAEFSRGHNPSTASHVQQYHAIQARYIAYAAAHKLDNARLITLLEETKAKVQRSAEQLDAMPKTLRFCKSDTRFANIIQRPDGRIGVIDWEDSGLLDPMRSVADLLTHANNEDLLTWQEWQPFIEPYMNAHAQTDPQAWERLKHHRLFLVYAWLMIFLNSGMRAGSEKNWSTATINRIPALTRIRRYLARAIAWPRIEFSDELDQLANLPLFSSE